MRGALLLACLLTLHTPDGSAFYVEGTAIVAIRPVADAHKEHVAEGSRSVVYTLDKNFAVEEQAEEVINKMHESCAP